ncbi:MAG: histidinol-phosphatase HisJ family protein [Lachnospiraceae bacterium]|nr:histidinol-phosphatase HisJ family protein [Lachnospiraceae bacterium]
MIKHDFHLHSYFSTDSEEKQENIIEEALERGFSGICFTDHMDLYFPLECSKKSGGDFNFDADEYYDCIMKLKHKYRNIIKIYLGMEIGLRDEEDLKDKCVKEYNELIAKYPFDFIIGSTHCLENIDPYWEEYWDGRTAEEGLRRYYDAIDKNVSDYDCFDSLGHLDYLVRYVSEGAALRSFQAGQPCKKTAEGGMPDFSEKRFYGKYMYDPKDYMDYTDSIMKKLIDKGRALEINTAGLKYGLGFAHPKLELLKRYRELGGELITIGSDAHRAEHLAYDFDKASELLINLGYRYYFIYNNRKPEGNLL